MTTCLLKVHSEETRHPGGRVPNRRSNVKVVDHIGTQLKLDQHFRGGAPHIRPTRPWRPDSLWGAGIMPGIIPNVLAGRTSRERSEIWDSRHVRRQLPSRGAVARSARGFDKAQASVGYGLVTPLGRSTDAGDRLILADPTRGMGQSSAYIGDALKAADEHGRLFKCDHATKLEHAVAAARVDDVE